MFDQILEKLKQIFSSRLIPVFMILIVLFSVLINRLFTIQIIEGQNNSNVTSLHETKKIVMDASRGLIRARGGEILADNELVYTVELYDVLSKNEEKNSMLHYLITTLEEYGTTPEYNFGITYDGNFNFNLQGEELNNFLKNALVVDDLSQEDLDKTAEDVFIYMREKRFFVSEDYSIEEAVKIVALRYAMYTMWPKYNPVIICHDISEETAHAISERQSQLPGVEIGEQSHRVYSSDETPELFAHLIGYTGLISPEELTTMNADGTNEYDKFDRIGKAGIEKSFEEVLAGTKGVREITVDRANNPVEELSRVDPGAGSDVYLTTEQPLQKAIYQIIEQNLAGILLSKINNSKSAGTRGESSSDIRIPIYDVYFALINNSLIDIAHFQEEDATDLEKSVYNTFLGKQNDVISQLDQTLALNSTRTSKQLSDEMNDYLSHIYELLLSKEIIDRETMDTSDSVYSDYVNDRISLSQFLQYALANNWIDLTDLKAGDEYYSTDELYEKLIEHVKELLVEDKNFHKLLYYYLVYSYKLSGSEICLLLFDQGVLEYNEDEVSKLKNGTLSSYKFITDKIRNLEITPAQLALEPFSASVIVTDVKTGKVRSMVSYPSYDNNNYVEYLGNDLTSPLFNRALKEAIAPGSTYKMVSAITGLEEGVITPYEKIKDLYEFKKITPHAKCWYNNHGLVNVVEALEVSCNYFFYEVGWRLSLKQGEYVDDKGLNSLTKFANLLGLGRENTNLEKELGDTSRTQVSTDSSVRSAIGQGSNIFTATQLSRYVTTIANSGKNYDLTIIDKIYDGETEIENEAEFEELSEISDRTWKSVQEGMYRVGNGEGSSVSHLFKDLKEHGVSVAGKTGTAQISKDHANHALFVSYGPYENPEISVTVVIPNGYSSGNAAELARDVYSYYFEMEDESVLLDGKAELPDSNTPAFSD